MGETSHFPDASAPLRPIEFTTALRLLHGLIDADVQVLLNLPGYFFDCGFKTRLERVQTLSGDDGPVLLVFGRDEGIALDPDELKAFLAGSLEKGQWLEFQIAERARLVIEPCAKPFEG
jgi:hypothetical protein